MNEIRNLKIQKFRLNQMEIIYTGNLFKKFLHI